MKSLANEAGVSAEPEKVRELFFKRLYINYSENVKPSNSSSTGTMAAGP
jgi:hypothetical protein